MGIIARRLTRFRTTSPCAYLNAAGASYPLIHVLVHGPFSMRCSHADSHLSTRGGSFGLKGTRVICAMAGILALTASPAPLRAQPPESAGQLIRETIYNELQDHNNHGYWRYWIQQRIQNDIRLEEQVETTDGPISRLVQTNGHPPDDQARDEERARLEHLVNSPQEQSSHRKDYMDDQKHVAMIMALLPEAYIFEYAGQEGDCHHLRFRPSPDYSPHTVEARIVHAMAGDLWIDARMKRLSRLEGHLDENVDWGFGLLGRLDKGGSFRVERVQVSPTEWKTRRLELHLSGHAVLFKTIGRDTNEVRGGFAAVPAGLNLVQGMRLLEQHDPSSVPNTVAQVSPVSLSTRR
jgi:hypothetical protein